MVSCPAQFGLTQSVCLSKESKDIMLHLATSFSSPHSCPWAVVCCVVRGVNHLLYLLCLVGAAVCVQLPDVVLLQPPPGVLWVPVWGSFQLAAHVSARPAEYQRLPARVHPQEGGHVVHPGPQQHPAGVLGAVMGHFPLREEAGGRGRRHPDSGDAELAPEPKSKHKAENRETSSEGRRPDYWTELSSAVDTQRI